jgi:hypothetical protein
VNALADARVVNYLNDSFICTFLKVGTFQIINGQKVGGNVASYFCQSNGSVLHAVPGQVGADKLLAESRWAYETRKSAVTLSTSLGSDRVDATKYSAQIRKAHTERFFADGNQWPSKQPMALPMAFPRGKSQQAQVHWLLGRTPLAKLDTVYPVVWERILREKLSGVPVEKR